MSVVKDAHVLEERKHGARRPRDDLVVVEEMSAAHSPVSREALARASNVSARAVATLFGGRNTPTTGIPSIAATKSHSKVPLDSSGHSVANEPASASSDSKPIACNHRTTLDSSRRIPSSPYAASASYPDVATPRSIFVAIPGAAEGEEFRDDAFLAFLATGNGTNWYDSEHRFAPSSAHSAGVPVTVASATFNAETSPAAAATASVSATFAGAPTSGDRGVPGRDIRGVDAYANPLRGRATLVFPRAPRPVPPRGLPTGRRRARTSSVPGRRV